MIMRKQLPAKAGSFALAQLKVTQDATTQDTDQLPSSTASILKACDTYGHNVICTAQGGSHSSARGALWAKEAVSCDIYYEYGWRLDKLGEAIEPHDVVPNGNRKLHAVGRGVTYCDEAGIFEVDTLDAPLVAAGEPSLLDFNNDQPPMTHGMHVNLFNNVWGTNFQMWYDDDTQFRFTLRCA